MPSHLQGTFRPTLPTDHFPKARFVRFTGLAVELCRGGFEMNSQRQPETLKIVIEEVSDHFRVFNTNFELTALPGLQISRYELPEEAEWSALASEAVQLPGVETVMLRPYGLGI